MTIAGHAGKQKKRRGLRLRSAPQFRRDILRTSMKHAASTTLSLLIITAFYAGEANAQVITRCLRSTENTPPATEFVAARWKFGTNGLIRHCGWSHNYPWSEQHLNEFVAETTRIDVEPLSYQLLELGSNQVFEHPFTYVSEPGEMELTELEVENLREYINRGGFILIDDFDGPRHLAQLRQQM